MLRDKDILRRLELGEDQRWEFKQVEFADNRPESPGRNDLADEMIAFANSNGGWLFMGVTDKGALQGMSRVQMDALDKLLVEVSTDAIRPSLPIEVHRRVLDDRNCVLASITVRREKALLPCGCKSHPTSVVPVGSGQSGLWR